MGELKAKGSERTIRPIHILPALLAANHILDLLALHLAPLVVALLDQEAVGAGAAFEGGLAGGVGGGAGGAGYGEGVGAGGTDCWGGVLAGLTLGGGRGEGERG